MLNGVQVDTTFNERMDKFKAKGCHFKTTGFSPFVKRESNLPWNYFEKGFWESIKHALGFL